MAARGLVNWWLAAGETGWSAKRGRCGATFTPIGLSCRFGHFDRLSGRTVTVSDPAVVERLPAGILGGIFSDHHWLAWSLEERGEGVVDEPILLALSVVGIENLHHVALRGLEFLLKECREIHLPDEAYSLGIFLVGGRKIRQMSYLAHLRLGKVADREERLAELLLRELAEEVALVLVRIHAF